MSLQMVYYLEYVAVYILMTWATYLPFRGGQLYNGPVYCMAVGGYFSAFAVRDLGWPFGLALIGAVGLAAIMGFIPALGFCRTTGLVTAISSIALIYIIQSVIRNLDFLGGSRGFWNIPKVEYLLPIAYGIVLVIGFLIYRFDHSRFGRATEAMLVDPELAASMGIDTRWLSVALLTVSSVIGALAGAIYAFTSRTIYPESFGFALLLYVWSMMYIGGRYTMWGALVSVPILWGLPQWVPQAVAEYTNIFYGALLMLTIMLRPQGLVTRGTTQYVVHMLGKIRGESS